MNTEMRQLLRNLIRDAATFLNLKVVDDILTGPEGSDYPKSGYASGISPGETGFVGVDSSGLRRSINLNKESDLEWRIFSENIGAPYNVHVDDWAQKKYGMGFFDIALELYGRGVLNLFSGEVAKFISAVTNNRVYNYQNPFPA